MLRSPLHQLSVVIILCISFFVPGLLADIPKMINYQGKATDGGGTPVPDGAYTVQFRIYDADTGGNLEWDSGNRSVNTTDGIFAVLLGESPMPDAGSDL